MEQEKDVRTELRELTDSASLLLDETTYTKSSCDRLIEAIGLAKVALQNWKADDETLQKAYDGLCEAVDGLQNADEAAAGARKKREAGKAIQNRTGRKAGVHLAEGRSLRYLRGSYRRQRGLSGRKPEPETPAEEDLFTGSAQKMVKRFCRRITNHEQVSNRRSDLFGP